MKPLLAKCIAFAATKHIHQFDKAGQPYILHPLKVMYYLKSEDEELQCIAVLHDVLEDTDTQPSALFSIGCTQRIINGVLALTKSPDDTNDKYLARLLRNEDACRVKLADLRHNSDLRRLKGVTQKDLARNEKYMKMYKTITEVLNVRPFP